MKKKIPWEKKVEIFLIHKIRLAWRYYSPARKKCLEKKRCQKCNKKAKLYADHIEPVVPVEGFSSWDQYIRRMFSPNLQALCEECHQEKTNEERKQHKEFRKKSEENNGKQAA